MGRRKKGGGGHRAKANKAKASNSPKMSGKKSNASSADSDLVVSLTGGQRLPGLSNLGNTCFFNAVMQNIGQSHAFRMRMGSLVEAPTFSVELQLPRPESELKLEVVGEPGELTRKLHDFIKVMQSSGGRTINPRPVFQEISQKGSRFAGYQRQDSQELLRYLLDKLRNEEVDRIKRAILKTFGVTGKANHQLSDVQKSDIRKYGMQALMAQTFVDDVFGGMLVSTVQCVECGNCTSMKETFLDLSLPVAEDKGSGGGGGGGGHQMRDRKGPGQSTSKALPKDVSQENLPMSKHQKKKQHRESRRATKKSNRVTKNLNDFLNEDHSNTAPTPTSDADILTTTPEKTATPTESVTMDKQQPENKSIPEPNSSIDPATGEPKLITTDDETSQEPQPAPDKNTPENGGATSAPGVCSYASSGPPAPSQEPAPTPSQEPAPTPSQSSQQTPLIGELEDLKLDDCDSNTEDCNIESQVEEGKNAVEESADSEPLTKEDIDKKSAYESNSLLFSFDKFCAREILTGDNKFACAVCTKELAEKAVTVVRSEGENGTAGDEISGSNKESASQGVTGEVESGETSQDGDTGGEEIEETGEDKQTEENEETQENKEEEEEESESEEEMEDESSKDKKSSSSDVKIAFCDAIKQILIETPPPVLTLHLKRFSHQGKRLKKNNRHISFPALLDLRPFCTQNCQDLCDASGRVLYSLYGVVVHSGGMQDGHYTSYTKTRPSLHENIPSSKTTQEALEEAASQETSLQEAASQETPLEEAEAARADVESDDYSKQYNSSTGERVTSDNPDPALPKKLPNTEDASCKSEEESHPICPALTTEALTHEAEKSAELTSSERDEEDPPCDLPSKECSSREFDFSLTAGQWYFASDTHVKAATEAEVMRSQAYLLFYERLPLRS